MGRDRERKGCRRSWPTAATEGSLLPGGPDDRGPRARLCARLSLFLGGPSSPCVQVSGSGSVLDHRPSAPGVQGKMGPPPPLTPAGVSSRCLQEQEFGEAQGSLETTVALPRPGTTGWTGLRAATRHCTGPQAGASVRPSPALRLRCWTPQAPFPRRSACPAASSGRDNPAGCLLPSAAPSPWRCAFPRAQRTGRLSLPSRGGSGQPGPRAAPGAAFRGSRWSVAPGSRAYCFARGGSGSCAQAIARRGRS